MANPIFSNSIVAEAFNKFRSERLGKSITHSETLTLQRRLEESIRNYFYERKCICDKNINDNVCDKCYEDNMIEKDLIGVFRIAE